ncbi:MAG: hypothetical protein VKJ64_15455 [Leptolyngbyaceae bacterium]|nr:hypothetical protein [Leptolyngbyaceae bacterium]
MLSATMALFISSCSSNKVSQCNRLITTINQTEGDLENITQTTPPDINALKQIATTTQLAVTNLNEVELANGDLKGFQARFQQFYGDISQNAQTIVAAYGEQNMDTAEAAYQQLESTFSQQETLVNSLNQYCSEGYGE